jgi:hypothetical protein
MPADIGQSTPQMNQAPAATSSVAPSSFVAAAPQAAPQAPAVQPAPQAYQVGMGYPQAVSNSIPQAAPSYQSSPTQYAPQSQPAEAPQGNPWESAFNKVMNVLSTPVQSPFQDQSSATQTQYAPVNSAQQSSVQATQQLDPQTLSASQAYLGNSSQTSSNPSLEALADQAGMSEDSKYVMNAHGIEAPAILNQYALNLEGLLDDAVKWGNQAQDLIRGYADFSVTEHQENLAYNEILTNPDVLSDYTLKFFGPEGPCPVYENEQQLETQGYPTAPQPEANNNVMAQVGQNFPAPPEAAAPQQPENFWGSFSETMARDPQNAWKVLNQVQPNTVQNKLFVME